MLLHTAHARLRARYKGSGERATKAKKKNAHKMAKSSTIRKQHTRGGRWCAKQTDTTIPTKQWWRAEQQRPHAEFKPHSAIHKHTREREPRPRFGYSVRYNTHTFKTAGWLNWLGLAGWPFGSIRSHRLHARCRQKQLPFLWLVCSAKRCARACAG